MPVVSELLVALLTRDPPFGLGLERDTALSILGYSYVQRRLTMSMMGVSLSHINDFRAAFGNSLGFLFQETNNPRRVHRYRNYSQYLGNPELAAHQHLIS